MKRSQQKAIFANALNKRKKDDIKFEEKYGRKPNHGTQSFCYKHRKFYNVSGQHGQCPSCPDMSYRKYT